MHAKRFKFKLPWNTRRGLMIWIASGFLVPTLYLAWHIFGWPEPIRISHETTRLTEPLTEDGYVDFLQVMKVEMAQGETAYDDDPWRILMDIEQDLHRPAPVSPREPPPAKFAGIVYREPVEFLKDELGDEHKSLEGFARIHVYEEALDGRLRQPFTAANDPVAARAIVANARWYQAIEESYSPGPLLFKFPQGTKGEPRPSADAILLNIHQYSRQIGRRFCLRSMLSAGNGDLEGALSDVDFMFRVASRMEHGCLMSTLIAKSVEQEASRAAVMQLLTASQLTPDHCAQIEALPQSSTLPTVVRLLDRGERFVYLDLIQSLHSGRDFTELGTALRFNGSLRYAKSARFRHAVNWNRVLVQCNAFQDAVVVAAQQSTWQLQDTALRSAEAARGPVKLLQVDIDDMPPWSTWDPTDWVIGWLYREMHRSESAVEAAHTCDLRRRAVQIIARLAMWRQVHGRFPEHLSSVLEVEGLTEASPELLLDPFANTELAYSSSGEGFVLSSVGPNMVKDEFAIEECSVNPENIRTLAHQDYDYVWRWPSE